MGCCGCLKSKFTQRVLRFLFSDFGLCVLVVTYTIAGGFIFIAIEGDNENTNVANLIAAAKDIEVNRNQTITAVIMNTAVRSNDSTWKEEIHALMDNYQSRIIKAISDNNYKGYVPADSSIVRGWAPASAVLFTATILTTIGYGHVCPVTEVGKLVVIFYAIFAVPLMTLFLTNVGMGMADVIRIIWNRTCCRSCAKKHDKTAVGSGVEPSAMDQLPQQAWAGNEKQLQEMLATEAALKRLDEQEKEEADVPVLLSLGFVVLYVLCGTLLFWYWQGWSMTESGYFCMVSLLTIGFGDMVPGMNDATTKGTLQKAFGSFYIILGLSMLAMGMNLMTHTIKHHLKQMAARVAEKAARKRREQQDKTLQQGLYRDHNKDLQQLTDFPRATPIGVKDNKFY